jgi:hypothetical protein
LKIQVDENTKGIAKLNQKVEIASQYDLEWLEQEIIQLLRKNNCPMAVPEIRKSIRREKYDILVQKPSINSMTIRDGKFTKMQLNQTLNRLLKADKLKRNGELYYVTWP